MTEMLAYNADEYSQWSNGITAIYSFQTNSVCHLSSCVPFRPWFGWQYIAEVAALLITGNFKKQL